MVEVKVLGFWASPYSLRIKVALELNGVDYEYLPEKDLWNKSQLLLNSNPVHKKIPAFIHNRKSMAESSVILEYIEDTWGGNALLPSDPHLRAQARFWAKFIDDKLTPTIRTALMGRGERAKRARKEAEEQLKILENKITSTGNKLFEGKGMGLLDIVGVVIAYWVPAIQEAAGKELLVQQNYPSVCSWAHNLLASAVIRENLPPKEKLVAFYRDLIAAIPTTPSKL